MSKLFKLATILCMVFTAFMLNACKEDESNLSVTPSSLQFRKMAGESQTLFIEASGDWTIENNTDFLSLSETSGSGAASVTATTNKNNNGGENTGELIVKCGKKSATVKAVQEGVDMELMVQIQDESILEMSNGIAIAAHAGPKVKYFQIALYKTDEYNKLAGPDDVIKDIKVSSGKKFYPNYPDDVSDGKISVTYDDVIAWYKKITDNTQYTIVAVPYDSNGNTGEISVKPVTTKSSTNQPLVSITDYKLRKGTDGAFHQWTATTNNFCSYYYVYSCIGSKKSNSYVRDDNGIVLAWYIKTHLSDVSDAGYEADFNGDVRHCREIILPQMSGSGPFTIEKESSDAYSEILAWGFSSNNNPSGTVTVVKEVVGAEPDDSGTTTDLSVSPHLLSVISSGACTDFKYGKDVNEIYCSYFTATEISSYSDKDLISKLKKEGTQMHEDELDYIFSFSDGSPNKKYVLCCVGISKTGTAGALSKTTFTTGSSSSQPQVTISDPKATTYDGQSVWMWTVTKNSICTKYYQIYYQPWDLTDPEAAWIIEEKINADDIDIDTANTTWYLGRSGSQCDIYIRGANNKGVLSNVINSVHIFDKKVNTSYAPSRAFKQDGVQHKSNLKDMDVKVRVAHL